MQSQTTSIPLSDRLRARLAHIRQLWCKTQRARQRRAVLRNLADCDPHLLRDIGFEPEPPQPRRLKDPWTL